MNRIYPALILMLCGSLGFAQESPHGAASASEEKFRAMATLAQKIQVFILRDGKEIPATLRDEPVMKYGDGLRKIKESTLWAWMDGPQPVAFQKIEVNVWNGPENPFWTFCIASATPQRLKIVWPFRPEPFLTEPLPFVTLGGVDIQTQTEAALKLQLRSLVRDVKVTEGAGKTAEEIRLLPHPLLSIADPGRNVHGAVFGYAMGTNPDALVILRTIAPSGTQPELQCSVVHMTSSALTAAFRETEVHHIAGQRPGLYETWGYFFANAGVSE